MSAPQVVRRGRPHPPDVTAVHAVRAPATRVGLSAAVLIVVLSACYDDLVPNDAEHVCATCRACETCVLGENGPECRAEAQVEKRCAADGAVRWFDACGDAGAIVAECRHGGECVEEGEGEARCACTDHWTGAECDICPRNFDAECKRCRGNWTGERCETCPKGFDATTDCRSCRGNWQGENCDECPAHWTGEDCDVCPEQFDAASGCSSCSGGWTGELCDVCPPNWDSASGCTTCAALFWGERCEVCLAIADLCTFGELGQACGADHPCDVGFECRFDTTDYVGHRQCTAPCADTNDCTARFGPDAICVEHEFCAVRCDADEDCPSFTRCDAGWCQRAGSNSGNPYCDGTPVPCSTFDEETCETQPGCHYVVGCSGDPGACGSRLGSAVCNLTEGCTWEPNTYDCTGTPAACDAFTSDDACSDQGCTWQDGCLNVSDVTDCTEEGHAACIQTPGCEWVTD